MKYTIQLRIMAAAALAVFCLAMILVSLVSAPADDVSYEEAAFAAEVIPGSEPAEQKGNSNTTAAVTRGSTHLIPGGKLFHSIGTSEDCDLAYQFTYITYCIGQTLYLAHRVVRI